MTIWLGDYMVAYHELYTLGSVSFGHVVSGDENVQRSNLFSHHAQKRRTLGSRMGNVLTRLLVLLFLTTFTAVTWT